MKRNHIIAFGLAVFIAVSMTAVAAPTVVLDDVEDGDTNIEAAGWSGWSGNPEVNSTNPIAGSYSLYDNRTGVDLAQFSAIRSSVFSPKEISVKLQPFRVDGQSEIFIRTKNGSSEQLSVRFDGSNNILYKCGSDSGVDYTDGTRYKVRFYNISYTDDTTGIEITDLDSNTVILNTTKGVCFGIRSFEKFQITFDADQSNEIVEAQFDDVRVNDQNLLSTVSGYVKDADGNGLQGATVTLNGQSTTTSGTGYYEFQTSNGTYTITANKNGYEANSTEITVNGSDVSNTNLTLLVPANLVFDAPTWMDHGESISYRIYDDSGSSRTDITNSNNVSISSSDSTVVSIDENKNKLIATNNVSKQERVTITITYKGHILKHNVTVANRTLENIGILPPDQYLPAFLGIDNKQAEYGIGSPIQWTLLAIFIGAMAIGVTRNEWLGIGVSLMGLIVVWTLGHISLGLMLAGFSYALFAGLVLLEVPSRDSIQINNERF